MMHTLPYLLKRTEDTNNRHYFKYGEADRFYKSVTTWQKDVLPTAPGLIEWMKGMTPEEQAAILLESSHKGTFLHEVSKQYADYERSFPIKHAQEYVEEYLAKEPELSKAETQGWDKRTKKWVHSLNAFFIERDVVPLTYHSEPLEDDQYMTEIALAYEPCVKTLAEVYPADLSEDMLFTEAMQQFLAVAAAEHPYPFAGAVDLVCEMTFNGRRGNAIVDYKTGNIYPSHAYQLEAYKLLVEHNFDIEIDWIFNFTDKDWDDTKEPTYTLKNQTGKVSPQEMAGLYIVANERSKPNPRPHVEYEDIIKGEGTWTVLAATEYYQEEQE